MAVGTGTEAELGSLPTAGTAGPPRMRPAPMVELRRVRKAFGAEVALADIDLSVERGQVLALLGPNGAGKTTLVRILAGLLKPDSGAVFLAGADALRERPSRRQAIGLSGQFAATDDLLSGRENLELVARLHHLGRRESRRRAAAALERFGLAAVADRQARTYSGGLLRRLDLALALIARPPLLVLDEPTTGLDLHSRLDLWELIDALVAEGATLLLTTQYLEEADRLGHRVAVLDRGRVIAEGSPAELKARVGEDSIELHAKTAADFERARAVLSPLHPDLLAEPARRRLRLPAANGVASLTATLLELEAAAVAIDEIALRQPSLDDVFLALTGHPAKLDAPAAEP
jgi:ABC-2 type transport system ATP-binding protein